MGRLCRPILNGIIRRLETTFLDLPTSFNSTLMPNGEQCIQSNPMRKIHRAYYNEWLIFVEVILKIS